MRIIVTGLLVIFSSTAFAIETQTVTNPVVGRSAAAKYFTGTREVAQEPSASGGSFFSPNDHYLALSLSKYMGTTAYEWGQSGSEDDVGRGGAAVTYRMGEWKYSMDSNIRIDYNEFATAAGRATKLSIMPLITFPEASSKFPLFFGAGVGPGIFFKQVPGKSSLSLDYQLVAGARFFNVYDNMGFVIESGIKNHLSLLSSGQLNGTYLAFGLVFTF